MEHSPSGLSSRSAKCRKLRQKRRILKVVRERIYALLLLLALCQLSMSHTAISLPSDSSQMLAAHASYQAAIPCQPWAPPMESGSTPLGSHPGSRANSWVRAWTAPGHSRTADQQTTTCPRVCLYPLGVLLDLKGKIKTWQLGPGSCPWPTVLFSRVTKQAGRCPAGDPEGFGGDPLFFLHYMLGDGTQTKKARHSAPTQTPSPDIQIHPCPLPPPGYQASIVFHLVHPALCSLYHRALSGTQIGSQCWPTKSWTAKAFEIGSFLPREWPWP